MEIRYNIIIIYYRYKQNNIIYNIIIHMYVILIDTTSITPPANTTRPFS